MTSWINLSELRCRRCARGLRLSTMVAAEDELPPGRHFFPVSYVHVGGNTPEKLQGHQFASELVIELL